MFELISTPLELLNLKEGLQCDEAGAFVAFEGWVRNHNEGQQVTFLEYEAFDKLCLKEAERIIQEAKSRFPVYGVKCLHRVGKLHVGEMAVWIGVTAEHREDAFKACRHIIDEIKFRVPIWKKEYYESGDSGWVNCEHCQEKSSASSSAYYSQQTVLPEIGLVGQERLKNSSVLVIGAGGLGSSALMSLAQMGIGTIGICEFDVLEESNLHRQSLYSFADVGKPKIELAKQSLEKINPFVAVKIYAEKLSAGNVEEIFAPFNIVLDCTDNFLTKFLINDACVLLKKALVQASIYQFEGQLSVYNANKSSACLRCLWPEIPEQDCVGSCAQSGVLGVVPSVFGHWQAMEAVKYFLNLEGLLNNETLMFDFISYRTSKVKQPPSASCPVCSSQRSISEIRAENYMPQVNEESYLQECSGINPQELNQYQFVDVREEMERLLNPVANIDSIHLPLSQMEQWDYSFDPQRKYLIFCEKGIRSLMVAKNLHQVGIKNVCSLDVGASDLKKFLEKHNYEKPALRS